MKLFAFLFKEISFQLYLFCKNIVLVSNICKYIWLNFYESKGYEEGTKLNEKSQEKSPFLVMNIPLRRKGLAFTA